MMAGLGGFKPSDIIACIQGPVYQALFNVDKGPH
jgi:hypothetical protein